MDRQAVTEGPVYRRSRLYRAKTFCRSVVRFADQRDRLLLCAM